MKTIVLTAVVCIGSILPLLADDTNTLADDKSRASYALGMMLGHNWQQQNVDVNPDIVLRGLKDQLSGGATLMTPQEVQPRQRQGDRAVGRQGRGPGGTLPPGGRRRL